MRKPDQKIWSIRGRVGIGRASREASEWRDAEGGKGKGEGEKQRGRTRGEKKEAGREVVIQIKYPGIETTGGKNIRGRIRYK